MIKSKKFKYVIFDLDGVLFHSKNNMRKSWQDVRDAHDIKVSFKKYFEKIGVPFLKILILLGLRPDIKIFRTFQNSSMKNINLIKPYPGVVNQFKIFKQNSIKFSILTSKDLKRSKYLLKKYNILAETIHCPQNKLRGKPYPDQILDCIKKNNLKKKNVCYVGDTYIDYLTAKRAKIGFIFAKYGYGHEKKIYKNKILNIKDLNKYLIK